MTRTLLSAFLAIFAVTTSIDSVEACPFCGAPSLSLAEQMEQSDVVVRVKWKGGTKPTEESAGETLYEVVDVAKGPSTQVKKGDTIKLVRYRAGKETDQFVLMATIGKSLEWGSPLEVSKMGYDYMVKAPKPKVTPTTRLKYFMRYLEHPDILISNDAYAEFAAARYQDIVPLKDEMPRDKIRKLVMNSNTPVTRLGFYGLLLGLCGTDADAELMRQKITAPSTDFRLGIDGVMAGYLLLAGDKALDVIDRTKLLAKHQVDADGKLLLDKDGKKQPVPFSETYAAIQALRFMWNYAEDRIPKDRLRKSMRILLSQPDVTDLVIADLARWKDWSVVDRLMELYGDDDYDIPTIKRAIIRFMVFCSKDVPDGKPIPPNAKKAQQYLAQLEMSDPKLVREAKRYLLP